MHENSLEAYFEEKKSKRLSKRAQEIVTVLKRYKTLTAREIMISLDYEELNQVRPRLTELKQANIVHEIKKDKWA